MKKHFIFSSSVLVAVLIFLCASLLLAYDKSFNDDVMLSKPYTYCYACFESDMYLRVRGTDSPEMKERAYKEFGCKPFTMVSKCDTLTSKDKTTKIMGILK